MLNLIRGWLLALLCMPGLTLADDAEEIRRFMEALDAGHAPVVSGSLLQFPDALSGIYRSRSHQPIWLAGGELSEQVGYLIVAIEEGEHHGLPPRKYHLPAIEAAWSSDHMPVWELDILLTDAFLAQAAHRSTGAVSPASIDDDWHVVAPEADIAAIFDQLISGHGSVLQALSDLLPRAREYHALVEERRRIAATEHTDSITVPPGPALRRGDRGERVLALQERLLGPGAHDGIYGPNLEAAVMAFQSVSGLEADGVVGANTIELLNASRFDWLDRLDANLERWRWLPRETPANYVRVNIASFDLTMVEYGQEVMSMDVIVGRPYRQSPVFTETIKYLVVNPFWNIPTRIAVQDKLPLLQQDVVTLAAEGYEARINGTSDYLPVDQIDWGGVTRRNFNYQLRQRPGPANALGRLKFMLPNAHAVYLHDTPARELFDRTERLFSSGCIRIADPEAFAQWLLKLDGSPSLPEFEQLMARNETSTVYLRQPVPVYIVYFTAFTDAGGNVVFRRDIYSRDRAVVEALRAS